MRVYEVVWSWIVAAYWQFHLAWVVLNQFACNVLAAPKRAQRRKIAVIGDGHAQGVGDWVVMSVSPGLPKELEALISRDGRLTFRWRVYPCGWHRSSSYDWLPPSSLSSARAVTAGRKNWLWAWFMEAAAAKDADVIIVILGSHDAALKITPADTVANLKAVCEELKARSKRVFLCTLPTHGAKGAELDRLVATNELIVKSFSRKETIDGLVVIDEKNNGVFKRADLYCMDHHHFNSRGYRELAKAINPVFANDLLKVQFAYFRDLLEPSKSK